jgi:hypothetical protein
MLQLPRGSTRRAVGRTEEFWLGSRATHTTTLRVRSGSEPNDRRATVRALSTRGGVAEMEIRW